MKPDKCIKFYTGFPSFEVVVTTFRTLRPTAENMYSWSQMQRLRSKGIRDVERFRKTMKNCKLGLFDQFYLLLEKLRVGTLNQVLADNFNVSQTTISRILITWENFLYFMLGSFLGPRCLKFEAVRRCFRSRCQSLEADCSLVCSSYSKACSMVTVRES